VSRTTPAPGLLLCAAALLGAAPVLAGSLELESVAQLRHDHYGELYVPAWQLMRFEQAAGSVELQGYAGFEWLAGVPFPTDTDIYHLSAAGSLGDGRLELGRQRGSGALRSQTFDGASYRHALGERLWTSAWLGMARHQDVDDILDFASVGRAELGWSGDALWLRGGLEMADGPDTELIARQDVEGLLRLGSGARAGRFGARAVVAEPIEAGGGAVLEWARTDLALRPWSPLELSFHAQHREAADPGSLFGDAIIDALAGGVVQEAGAGLRLIGARWSSLSTRTAVVSYGEGHDWGYKVDVAWLPGRSDASLRLGPALSSRTGPGGQFHALSSQLRWSASDATSLAGTAAVVPYRKGEQPWATLVTGGLQLRQRVAGWARLGAMVDLATDGGELFDVRGGATLELGWSS
jgi:hypothetical protein